MQLTPMEYGAFGLGTSMTAPYKDSGGAGYGGIGGCSGRGWIHGIMTDGYPYSDKEVPIPFGGSASSWAQTAPGNAGGGGVEIDATGNVTFGTNAKILAKGGTTLYISVPGRRRLWRFSENCCRQQRYH